MESREGKPMTSTAVRRATVEDYLAREGIAEWKSEFYDGEIFAMAGASSVHNTILANLIAEIVTRLKNGPCRAFPSDMRTRLPSGLYTYPDAIILCGKPEFAREDSHTLVNPTAVIEILSPSTERYDTGKKFRWYQETPSVQEIAFVSQDEPRFQVYRRAVSGWMYAEAAALDQSIHLHTGEVTLLLSDVYRNVEFPPPEAPKPTDLAR
jgi:Uma2 family endonuclease